MPTYTEVATILQRSFGQQEGLLVLEYFESRIPPDVARRSDLRDLRDEIAEDIRDLHVAVAATDRKISETEAALRLEIHEVATATDRKISETEAALRLEIEKLRADLSIKIAQSQATQTRWAFLFWASQLVVLVGVLYQLSH